jgi:thiamine pyrophosphate-dependent acetolactate synthase large subunit-like protein
MAKADCLLVLGASFSNHTAIATWVPTIQVDLDRMTLGKFHPVAVPLWGDIERTLELLSAALPATTRPGVRERLTDRWARWRVEKERRAGLVDPSDRLHPAAVFGALSEALAPDTVIAVDVGNNTYAFGHYFECRPGQDVLMSGYLGSIGFGFPAAMGAWAAVRGRRKVVAVAGDGGFGQYLAEFTTAVKYGMDITLVLLDNGELGKISREQISAIRPVWQTSLVNPDFATYAESCGGVGFRVTTREELAPAFDAALRVEGRPSLVAIRSSAQAV